MPGTPSRRLLRLPMRPLPLALCCAALAAVVNAGAGDATEPELEFRAAVSDGRHDSAAAAGEAWLDALAGGPDRRRPELVLPLVEVARAQRLAGDHDAAEVNLRQALALLPEAPASDDLRRFDAVSELGMLYRDADEHHVAVVAFAEARRLSRQHFGLLNEQQLQLLDHAAYSHVAIGDEQGAQAASEEALLISERRVGPDSPELLDALYRRAQWLHQLHDLHGEQRVLRRAIAIIEREGGAHDPRLIEPMLNAAASIRAERSFHADELLLRSGVQHTRYQQAVRLIARARDVARANPDLDPATRASILLEEGDWYMVRDRHRAAMDSYRETIALLQAHGRSDLVHEWFDAPVALLQPEPMRFGVRPLTPAPALVERQLPLTRFATDRERSEVGVVVARFEVDERGQTRHVRIVEAQPRRRMTSQVHSSLIEAVFRPRIVDGEPVASDEQRYTFTYAYRP